MHTQGTVGGLAEAKRELRARIAARREDCCTAVAALRAPLQWLDFAIVCAPRVVALLRAVRELRAATAPSINRREEGVISIAQGLETICLGIGAFWRLRREVDWWVARLMC